MPRADQQRAGSAMIGGLVHKIRDPLAAIKLSIELLLAGHDLQENDQVVLLRVVEEIRRIELLVKGFLDFAQPVEVQLTTLNINQVAAETVQFMENQPAFALSPPDRKIVCQFAADLPDTAGDLQKLQQAFIHLLLNAAEAMPGGGTVMIKTWCDADAGTVGVDVSDTGKGVPAALVEKIFDPFFTTKAQGIGLGLALAKNLVEAQGGRITATSKASAGAAIHVALPLRKP